MTRYKLVILGLINERPMYGYQINQEIKRRSIEMWANINTASIYNNLTTLKKEGLITEKREKVGKLPIRKVYSITAKGKKKLSKFIKQGLSKIVGHDNILFMLSVGFIANISKENALGLLKERRTGIELILSEVKELYQRHNGNIPFSWLYTMDVSLTHLQTELNGIEYLIRKLKLIEKL